MNLSNYTFFVCSTLNSTYGDLTFEERYEDTVFSLLKIRQKIPNCEILFIDNSNIPINDSWRSGIDSLVSEFYQLPHNLFSLVANIHKLKSSSEANMMYEALRILQNPPYCNSKRIFKISGRYHITDDFDVSEYEKSEYDDKYAFVLQEYASTYDNWKTERRVMRVETGLISWSPSLTQEFRDLMGSVLWQCLTNDNCIEESLFQHIPHRKIIPLDKVHVSGRKAEGKQIVSY